ERIAAAQLKKDLYFVSSDEMAGRDTPSPGLDATAKFLAERLKSAKLKPAGDDNTYFQTIEMRSNKVDAAQTRAEMGGKTFRYGEDFLIATTSGTASGALVYAGHGWVIPSKNIDAYQGVDVRDKIVIVSAGFPQGIERGALGNTITDAENPASAAQKRGARGVIMITNYPDFDRWWSARRRSLERSRPDIVRFQERDGTESKTQLPTIMPSVAMLNTIFDGEQQSAAEIMRNTVAGTAPEAFELAPQKRITFTVNVANVSINTQNVVAVLEGKDSVLKNEYVAVGAHYDHVGVGQAVNGDSIYNGADDDGSGTVAVLALAEALARAPRPRRSILFVWHSGEEKGLKGSEYFVEYPTVPLNTIVAQFNIDMIGRSKKPSDQNPRNSGLTGPSEIYVIDSKMMSAALGELSERVNKSYLNLSFNYMYD
ncbi:MAG: M28 family peptidase, partial [Pyrinomonadaceae bacterium]